MVSFTWVLVHLDRPKLRPRSCCSTAASPSKPPDSPQEGPWKSPGTTPHALGACRPDLMEPTRTSDRRQRPGMSKSTPKLPRGVFPLMGIDRRVSICQTPQNVGKTHPCQGGFRAGSRLLARGLGVRHGALHCCPKNAVSSRGSINTSDTIRDDLTHLERRP